MSSSLLRVLMLLSFVASLGTFASVPRLARAEDSPEPGKAASIATAAGQKWALLIGVDEYLDSRLGKLKYCGSDVLAMQKLLVDRAGFPADQVIVVHNKQSEDVRRPYRLAIDRHLRGLLAQPQPGDLVLIAFSGHGVHQDGRSYCPADPTPIMPRRP